MMRVNVPERRRVRRFLRYVGSDAQFKDSVRPRTQPAGGRPHAAATAEIAVKDEQGEGRTPEKTGRDRLIDGRADEPERPPSVLEEEGVASHQLEHPPKAEGDRDDVED